MTPLRAAIALVIVAVLATFSWFVFVAEQDAVPASVESVTDADVRSPSGLRPVALESAATSPMSSDDSQRLAAFSEAHDIGDDHGAAARPAGRVRIEGRVVDEFGRPVPEADVGLLQSEFERFGTGRERGTKRTDGNGRFAFEDVTQREGMRVFVRPLQHVDAWVVVPSTDGNRVDLGDIVTELGGGIAGHVLDGTGNPIAGAGVQAWPLQHKGNAFAAGMVIVGGAGPGSRAGARSTDTDQSGFFRIAGLPAGRTVAMATADGFVRGSVRDLLVEKGKSVNEVSITLLRGHSIEGMVIDERDKPIRNARISFMETVIDLSQGGMTSMFDESRSVHADEHGMFRIDGLKDGSFNLTVRSDPYLTQYVKQVRAGRTDVRIVLQPSGVLFGIVRDTRTATGVDEFEVRVRRADDEYLGMADFSLPTVLTGEDAAAVAGLEEQPGLYAVKDLSGTRVKLTVKAEGFTTFDQGSIEVASGSRVRVDADLLPEILVSGVVFNPHGKPVPGAKVTVDEKRGSVFGGAEIGWMTHSVEISADDDSHGHAFPGRADNRDISDANGRFTIRGLAAGDYAIDANHADWAPSETLEVRLREGDASTDIELVLRAGGGLMGTAFDDQGSVFPGARISLTEDQQAGGAMELVGSFTSDLPFGDTGQRTLADVNGHYEFHGLLPGDYRAQIERPSSQAIDGVMAFDLAGAGRSKGGVAVTIEEGQTAELDLRLPPTGTLAGTVTEAGTSVAGVRVVLKEKNSFMPFGVASGMTDSSGAFTLADLEPGDFSLEISAPGAVAPVTRDVTIRARQITRENVNLPAGIITGRVIDPSGDGLEGVTIDVSRSDSDGGTKRAERNVSIIAMRMDDGAGATTMTFGDESEQVTTDEQGFYEVRFLAAGDYTVEIRGAGVIPQSRERVRVEKGTRTDGINFQAAVGAMITVHIQFEDEGDEIQFFQAEIHPLGNAGESEQRMEAGTNSTTFDGLALGSYVISIQSGERSAEQTISVHSGDHPSITFTLR